MPPYDPKAKRPKLVPVDDDAPVDKLLTDLSPLEPESVPVELIEPQSESAAATESQRPSLSPSPLPGSGTGTGPRPALIEPAGASSKVKLAVVIGAAVIIAAGVVVVVGRRR